MPIGPESRLPDGTGPIDYIHPHTASLHCRCDLCTKYRAGELDWSQWSRALLGLGKEVPT